jgi:hypothetical protein
VQVAAAGQEVPEVLPALAVERHHLPIQDRLLDRQALPNPVAELVEAPQQVPPFGPDPAALPGDVQEPAAAVVLGLEQPGRVVERIAPRGGQDRLDSGEGAADSWADGGSQAA